MTTTYFAFGSNMLTTRLTARIESARPRGLATLPGWRLAFHKRGRDASGKCDIVHAGTRDLVLGVVFDVDPVHLPILDQFEGAGNGYKRSRIEVRLDDRPMQCETYRAMDSHIDPMLKPYDWYRRLVLAGLLEHGADPSYVNQVRQTPWLTDPRPDRPARRAALDALRGATSRGRIQDSWESALSYKPQMTQIYAD